MLINRKEEFERLHRKREPSFLMRILTWLIPNSLKPKKTGKVIPFKPK